MNLRKIGVMIHRCRLRRRNTPGRNDFRQDRFLSSSVRHPFFDIQPGYPVCSRATMLKLENGKVIQEEELYRFFLRKLDLAYAYSPLREQQYKVCFNAFDAIVTEGTLNELDCFDLPKQSVDNLLYDFYDRLLFSLHRFYTCALYPSVELMAEFSELWFCVPEQLRPITQIFILSATSAHPYYDQVDFHPILRKFPSHPLEILAYTLVAVAEGRFLLSVRLTDRFDEIGCGGELPGLLMGLIRRYTIAILGHPAYPAVISFEDASHPLTRLCLETLVFHLGKHAIEHDASRHALIYFGMLENCRVPYGVYCALIMNHPYGGDLPGNPKLKYLTDYLYFKESPTFEKRLTFLMTQVLPAMGVCERFLRIFLHTEVVALVARTQRYKYAYTYLSHLDPLRIN